MQKIAGNNNTDAHFIIADGRWLGPNGIGRFSSEVLTRLTHTDIIAHGPKPLSAKNLVWQIQQLKKFQTHYRVFFTPGFNPVLHAAMPYVLTVHDLIHLFFPGTHKLLKKIYYQTLLKPAIQRAHKILTVSEYSKKTIVEWANVDEEQVVVVGNGVSQQLTPVGKKYLPGFPYILHVGNTKPHKNVVRLVLAFQQAKLSSEMRLILTGEPTAELVGIIAKNRLENKIMFSKGLSEETLLEYYRGATAVALPSLYEGFGLPVIEAMACGVPVLTSNVTSLPEVAGDAALLVDPLSVDAIAAGLQKIIFDTSYRDDLIAKGLLRAALFSWDTTAQRVQSVLDNFK